MERKKGDNINDAGLSPELPGLNYRPLVNAQPLLEVAYILKALPALKYPINSAGELLAKYGQGKGKFQIAGIAFDPAKALKFMPAYYFPISSAENFAEKIAELLGKKRQGSARVVTELRAIKRQLITLRFPIADPAGLLKLREPGRQYFYRGQKVDPNRMARKIPATFFPIVSERDFDRKISSLLRSRV